MKINRFRHLVAADADQINRVPSYDGISPLMSTPDYNSDLSYSYYINNNQPFTKRKRLKKKRKPNAVSQENNTLQKVAFTSPTSSIPAFSDFKSPLNQSISIITNNFNATEKFMSEQQKYNDKVAKALDKLEQQIKDLKK